MRKAKVRKNHQTGQHDGIRTALPAMLLAAAFSWLTSAIFVTEWKLRLILGLVGLILPGRALYKLVISRREQMKLDEAEQFLAYLSGQISSGRTLERALLDAPANLKEQFGTRSRLVRLLDRLRRQLLAQGDLVAGLQDLDRSYSCTRLSQDLAILPWLRKYGGHIDVYLRESHRQIYTEIALKSEVEAENSQKTTEAAVMCFLPFLFGLLLFRQNINPDQTAVTTGWWILAGFIFHLIALLTISLTLSIIARPQIRSGKTGQHQADSTAEPGKTYPRLSAFYLKLLPVGLGYKISRIVRFSDPTQPGENLWHKYLKQKVKYLFCGFAVALLLFISRTVPLWFVPIAIIIFPLLQDLLVLSEEQNNKQFYRLSYPPFLSMLSLLMESGLTLQIALGLSIDATKKLVCGQRLGTELELAQKSVEAGVTGAEAVRKLAALCPLPEISAALRCAARYDQQGSGELLSLLGMQSAASWQIYRNGLRRQLEQRALFLFLPMGMALINVLAIAVVPALASFQTI
ncbi:MAG: hypothetical protein ACOYEL_00370 [Saccharofermentanales bacterium]|jgi:Flp pilus assembly protein TadB